MKKLVSVVLFLVMVVSMVLCLNAETNVPVMSPGAGSGDENLVEKVIDKNGNEIIIPKLPDEIQEKTDEWYREKDQEKKDEIEDEIKQMIEEKYPQLKDLRWIIIEHFHDEWPEEVAPVEDLIYDRAKIESIIGEKLDVEYAVFPLTGYHFRWVDFPVTGFVNVPNLEHFKVLYCLHYSFVRQEWESLEFEQNGADLIMYNISDVSPFVLITEAGYYHPVTEGKTGGGKKSPKTEDIPLEAVLGGVMLLCVAGAAVVFCRRKA